MALPGANVDRVGDPLDANGGRAVLALPIAQLPPASMAPTAHRPVRFEGANVEGSGIDSTRALEAGHRGRSPTAGTRSRRSLGIAELSESIRAPAPDLLAPEQAAALAEQGQVRPRGGHGQGQRPGIDRPRVGGYIHATGVHEARIGRAFGPNLVDVLGGRAAALRTGAGQEQEGEGERREAGDGRSSPAGDRTASHWHRRVPGAMVEPMQRHAPATERNRDPILEVLRRVLPDRGRVLEIAAGTGEHALYFAAALPNLEWQPTDPDPSARDSIAAWRDAEGTDNLRAPLDLDVTQGAWPMAQAAAVVAINMIHISPIEASEGLMRGAGALLPSGAPLVTYGPYRVDGAQTAASNEAFDASLRSRDPRWGVRDIGELEALAAPHGLVLDERVPMPANNFTLVWRKRP